MKSDEHKEIQDTIEEVRVILDSLRIRYYGYGRGDPTRKEYSEQLSLAAGKLGNLVMDIDREFQPELEDMALPFRNLFQTPPDKP